MAGYRIQDTRLSSFSGLTRESRRCPRKSRELYKELDSPINRLCHNCHPELVSGSQSFVIC